MPIDPELPDLAGAPTPPSFPADADLAIAATVVAHAAGTRHAHGPVHTHCENCGAKLAGPFCHQCGQHDFEAHRSFAHVFLEVLENFFHFESKFFGNVATLLFRPGRLTADFNAGKRAAQMPPFRLYLFVSVLFFFVLFLGGGAKPSPLKQAGGPEVQSALESVSTKADVNPAVRAAIAEAQRRHSAKEHAREGTAHPAPRKPIQIDGSDRSAFLRWLEQVGQNLLEPEYRERMAEAFVHSIPRLLLVCLPFFALYTRVLFRRSGLVYLQHLVLALHFHTFVYLWLMVRDGWSGLAGLASPTLGAVLYQLCMVWVTVYPLLMLRHLFRNSWPRTIVKTLVLAALYLITLSVGFVSALLIVLATL